MSDLLPIIAAYVPPSITHQLIKADTPQPPTEPTVDVIPAAVLFTDVSGFTPLTDALGQKGSEGPEELTRLLNRYFSWMIAFVEAEGGEVVKFGGDALTVVFSAQNEPLSIATRRAVQAANTMQSSMEEFGIMESSVGLVHLQMKFGVGAGELIRARVGGVDNRWEYVIAGDAQRQAAMAEKQAQKGEIILSPQAQGIVVRDLVEPKLKPRIDWGAIKQPDAVEAAFRCYVPKPILTWLDGNLHGWLATLRPMSVLFVLVNNVNYDQPGAIARIHHFVRGAQEIIYHYRGSLPRLTVDDKGTVLLILFGAPPHSHEDDPERALRCALELQEFARQQKLQLSIGVTSGRVFAGPVGGQTRREYTVMGDTVNLAARLMVASKPGQINCNYTAYRSANGQLSFEELPPIHVKGKSEPIPVYRPTGDKKPLQQVGLKTGNAKMLVGRQKEISELATNLDAIQAGQSRIVIVEGEAGIGKSQVVGELIRLSQSRGFKTLLGVGRSIEQDTPYRAWRDILAAYFGTDNGNLEAQVEQIAPNILPHLSSITDVLTSNVPANGEQTLPGESPRHQQLVSVLIDLFKSKAAVHRLVLILENAHWLDPYSWYVAEQIAREFIKEEIPLLLVLVMRPSEGSKIRPEATALSSLQETKFIRLDTLPSDEILTLTAIKEGLTSNELPEAVAELIRSRAGGNPFFAEELFNALYQNGDITFKPMQDKTRCLVSGDLDRAAQMLPATIQNVVLSRLDQLPPEEQLMLKIAAVIGQTFSYTALQNTLKMHLDVSEQTLKNYLEELTYLDFIVPATPEPNLTYTFKHTIIREVTYQSLLFDRRRQLHRTVALWYESAFNPQSDKSLFQLETEIDPNLSLSQSLPLAVAPLNSYYTLLVYHWHQAEDEEREQHYATLIGEQAVQYYANVEAIGYLSRAIDLTPDTDLETRYNLFLNRETVFNRRGDRERQMEDLKSLANLAEQLNDVNRQAEISLRRANLAEATGKYYVALEFAELAIEQAGFTQNLTIECAARLVMGKTLNHQGNQTSAAKMLNLALKIAEANKFERLWAEILYNIAIVRSCQGDLTEAKDTLEQALVICQRHQYWVIEAQVLNLIGLMQYRQNQIESASKSFEQAVLSAYPTGHRRVEVAPLRNIGLLYLKQGHFEVARDYFEQALDIEREIEDIDETAETLTHLAVLYANLGQYPTAQSYLGQALEIRREIGNMPGEADTMSKFGYIYFCQGNYEITSRYCHLALSIQQQVGDIEGEAYTQTYLGHALVNQKQFDKAILAYERALELRQKMHQHGAAIQVKAGLATVYLVQENLDQARSVVEEIIEWIDTGGVESIDNPLWVCLTCYKTLNIIDADKIQSDKLLDLAYTTLQTYKDRFINVKLQPKFLTHVVTHKEIIEIWQSNNSVPVSQMSR